MTFIDIGNGSVCLSEVAAATTNGFGWMELTLKSGATIATRLRLTDWQQRLEAVFDEAAAATDEEEGRDD